MPVTRPSGSITTDFGASEDTVGVTISAVTSLNNSFARIVSPLSMSGGPTAGTTTSRALDSLGCLCLLTADDTVTLTRRAAAENVDYSVAWEVIEFPSSGNDAAHVRMHQNITLSNGTATSNTPISGVGTIGNCVAIVCGISCASTSTTNRYTRAMVTAEVIDSSGANIRLTRGTGTDEVIVSVAVVEFTGSNWSVQKDISFSQATDDTVETASCSAVTWANTMIFHSARSSDSFIENVAVAVWNGATTTTFKHKAGGLNGTYFASLVSNANLSVEHINSVDGSETDINADGSDPMVVDNTVTSSTLADHFIYTTMYSALKTNADHIHYAWQTYLTSTTNLRWWNCESTVSTDVEWTGQLIDISGLSYVGTTPHNPFGLSLQGPFGGPLG